MKDNRYPVRRTRESRRRYLARDGAFIQVMDFKWPNADTHFLRRAGNHIARWKSLEEA